MRVVVLGGAGFVGSAVCRHLVAERQATVLNIDKLTPFSSLASLQPVASSPRYSFRRADICDREKVTALFHAFQPDAIVHAVVERQVSDRIGGAADALQTNALGTWRLLDATRDYWDRLTTSRKESFRFVSVSAAEGAETPAGASRAGADELVAAWHKSYGLPTIVSRAAATFGPYQFPNARVPAAIIEALEGAGAPAEASCAAGDWLHVDDHVDAICAMIEKGTPGATYTAQGCGAIDSAALVRSVRAIVARQQGGRAFLAAQKLAGDDHPRAAKTAPSARLLQDTGWKPQLTLESALSSTVQWYMANEAWWRPLAAAQAMGQDRGLLRIA